MAVRLLVAVTDRDWFAYLRIAGKPKPIPFDVPQNTGRVCAATAMAKFWPPPPKCQERTVLQLGHAPQQMEAAGEVRCREWLQGYVLSALNSRVTSLAKIVAG
jgi:hypothetical protein